MKSEAPVLFVHGYCDDWPRGKRGGTDVFSSMQALASSELLRRGKIRKVVFDLKCVQSDGQVVAHAMADQVRKNLSIDATQNPVITHPVATSTRSEVAGFKDLVDANKWTNFEVLAIKPHMRRVRRSLVRRFGKEVGGKVSIRTPEEVLHTEESLNRYRALVDTYSSAAHYTGMTKRENILNLIDAIPYVGGFLLDVGDRLLGGNKKLESLSVKLLGRG